MSVLVLARTPDLTVQGVVSGWTDLTATLAFNTVGSWSLKMAATRANRALFTPGSGVQIFRDDDLFLSGPVESIGFTRDPSTDPDPGTLTVAGADDLVWLSDRIVYPDPTQPATNQTAASNWVASGPAGTLMVQLVDTQVGANAAVPRRAPLVRVGVGSGVGASVGVNARYSPLMDELRSLALAGGDLRMAMVQVGTASGQRLQFNVSPTRDLSGSARFGFDLGNLRAASFTQQAPTGTRAIVAAQGVGTARNMVEFSDPADEQSWSRRIEQFVDQRQTNDPVILAQAGRDALAAGAVTVSLASTTVDSPTLRFGADDPAVGIVGYGLGDQVSVSPLPGVAVTNSVRQVVLTAVNSDTGLVTALVGDPNTTSVPSNVRAIRALGARLARLESI